MSVALPAAPALPKGGEQAAGTVGFFNPPTAPAPTTSGGGGGGGGGVKCYTTVDPVTGIGIGVCGKYGV